MILSKIKVTLLKAVMNFMLKYLKVCCKLYILANVQVSFLVAYSIFTVNLKLYQGLIIFSLILLFLMEYFYEFPYTK